MDIISLNEAATANSRIEKFNTNPDSNSGVLTQPKVIEAGETVRIKSGRQAILANTVVEGELVIEAGGEVFVPAGAGFDYYSASVNLTGDQTVAGVKTFTSSPIVPTPTTDFQVATKKYVDDAGAGGGSGLSIEDKAKLDSIEEQATKNETDAFLLSRSNHTGTIPMSVVENLEQELANISTGGSGGLTPDELLRIEELESGIVKKADLDSEGKILTSQLPVIPTSLPDADSDGKLYGRMDGTWTEIVNTGGEVDLSDYYKKTETYNKAEVDTKIAEIPSADLTNYYNKTEVDNKIADIPETDLTYYYTKSETYSKVKTDSLVDTKQDTLVSGTSIKTINGESVLGSGDIEISDATTVKLTGDQTIDGFKTFSSTLSGSITGNAGSATKLVTARTINGVNFDGTANITVSDDTKLTATNPSITGSITEQVYNLTGTEINPTNGTIQYKTVSANTTFTETLISGQSVLLRLINANSYTITFPTITWIGVTAPTLTANCAIVLWKEQSTLYGAYVGSLV